MTLYTLTPARATATVLVLWSVGLPAVAETLTLSDAIQTTLVQSATIRASAQDITAAEAQTEVARSGKLPQIDFRYSLNVSDDPLDAFAGKLRTRSVVTEDFAPDRLNNPDTSALFSGGVVLKYSLYNGGRTDAQIEGMLKQTDAARALHARVQQNLVFDTIRAYYHAQAAEQGLRIAGDALSAANKHARTTKELVQQDRTVQSDQLTARVNLSAFKSASTQASTGVKLAYNKLKLAMNSPQTQTVQVIPFVAPTAPKQLPEVESFEQRALQNREDLKALRSVLESAEASISANRAANGFHLDLMADTHLYEDNPAVDEASWRVFGVVRKDLYNGGRIKGRVDAAVARAEAVRFQAESLQHQIRAEVHAAYTQLQDSITRFELAKGNVAIARKNVELISDRYGEGRTILIDLLQAERALVDSRSEELAAAQAMLVSIAALRLADGSIDPSTPDSYSTVGQ